jgi:hypothetical protein
MLSLPGGRRPDADRAALRSGGSLTRVTRFPLAPISGDIRALTAIAFVAPLGLVLGAILGRGPVRGVLLVISVLVLVLYASVWLLWRPTAFEVDRSRLRILWPRRVRTIPACEIAGAVVLSREAFRREFGWAMRIGAGGLWGGFGWLYTSKGLLGLYVSRTDRGVLVRLRTDRPLVVTPEGDERFVAVLRDVSRG